MERNTIEYKFIGDTKQLMASIKEVEKSLQKNSTWIKAQQRQNILSQVASNNNYLGRINAFNLPKDYASSFTNLNTEIKALGSNTQRVTPLANQMNRALKGATKDLTNQFENVTDAFAGWAMSIMFFGMALQRVFDGIIKSSTKTFQEVMHSTEGTTTSFDQLEGSMKFLQFVVGDAIEPLAMSLLPLVDSITDFVMENEELTSSIIKWGTILGAIFAVGGAGFLAMRGFKELGTLIGVASNTTGGGFKFKEGALSKVAAIGATLYLVEDTVSDLANGKLLDAAGNVVFEAGILAGAFAKKKGLAGALIAIGAAITLTSALIEGKGSLSRETFAKWLIETGGMAMFANPAVGAALLTIGFAIQFMSDDFLFEFLSVMKMAVTILSGVVSFVLETMIVGITTAVNGLVNIVNGIIDAYNLLNGFGEDISHIEQPDWLKPYNLTKSIGESIEAQMFEYSLGKDGRSFTPANFPSTGEELTTVSSARDRFLRADDQTMESYQPGLYAGNNIYVVTLPNGTIIKGEDFGEIIAQI